MIYVKHNVSLHIKHLDASFAEVSIFFFKFVVTKRSFFSAKYCIF